MEKAKLLVVEDDPNLGQILSEYLSMKGFKTTLCQNGLEGLEVFRKDNFDLCILDIMMPKMDGFALAESIKKIKRNMPFIFLTAKTLKEDTLKGLRIGADDYITKPFSMEELLLRINAILRRFNQMPEQSTDTKENTFQLGSLTFESDSRKLYNELQSVNLTTKEAGLLRLLCIYRNRTLPRTLALKEIWGDDSYFNARSMDVYIAKLRKHLKPEEELNILTIHGEGFRLMDAKK